MRRDGWIAPFVLVGIAACGPPDDPPPTTSTEIVLQTGSDRLVIDEQHVQSFPDAVVGFVLHAEHAAGSHVVMIGSMQDKDLRLRATRLPNGHLAWALRDFVCEELSATNVACNDFVELGCSPVSCCAGMQSGWTTCACALSNPDPRIVDALRWTARDKGQDARLRAGAALALAHTGARSEATRIAESIPDDPGSIAIMATRLDNRDRDELRALRAKSSRCVIEQIDHACGGACQ